MHPNQLFDLQPTHPPPFPPLTTTTLLRLLSSVPKVAVAEKFDFNSRILTFLLGILTDIFDVAFLFDGSSYLGSDHFHQTLLLAKTLLSKHNISQDQTNVATAVYASTVRFGFNFTEHYSFAEVAAAIDNLPFLDETPLNIDNALRLVSEEIFTTDRENIPDVLVIFVSSTLSGNFTGISQSLREEGIKMIVVGVGSSFELDQLESIGDHVITISYQDLDVMEGGVGGAVSEGKLKFLYILLVVFDYSSLGNQYRSSPLYFSLFIV